MDIESVRTRYGRMFVPALDSVIGRSLKLYGEWAEPEIRTVGRYLVDGDAIVDVGANIGTHALAFAAKFPNSTIFAIEPQPLPFALLTGSVLVNGYTNIRPFNCACGEDTRAIRLSIDYEQIGWNVGALRLQTDAVAGETVVLMTSLDEIVQDLPVQFIKIDVEGMEASVLAGASRVLQRARPSVYFEVLDLNALERSMATLREKNYNLYWLTTSAFNSDNFNGLKDNIWYKGECGVLAFPAERDPEPMLTPVTGFERELPFDPYNYADQL